MVPLPTPLQVLRALRNAGIMAEGLALTMSCWVTPDFTLRETAGMAWAWQGSGEESEPTDRVPSHFTLTVSGKESNSVKSRPASLSAEYDLYSSFVSNVCLLITAARHLEGGNGPCGTWSTQPLKDLQALIIAFICCFFIVLVFYILSVEYPTYFQCVVIVFISRHWPSIWA